jgi:FMN-dependent oxidoreductase (nitrilotriacetate monooxygenase family)
MTGSRTLRLNLFLMGVGHHEAAWRHPDVDRSRVLDIRHYQDLAVVAERAGFDSVFLADQVAAAPDVRHGTPRVFEPLTLLTAIAAVTERIGLIGTASTSYAEPYNLARQFASLDHLSGGRAGWNIVTSAGNDAARTFGRDAAADHRERYQRAAEFVEVVTALWDSWDDDALVLDPSAGVFADDRRVHPVEHAGRFFRVDGPLPGPRSPQGHPLLVQAGSSPDGRAFAARHAEAVFTAQQTLAEGRELADDLRRRAAAWGRPPGSVAVLPGVVPILGSTQAEADRLADELERLIVPTRALRALSQQLGVDLSDHPLDEPLPALPPVEQVNGAQSRFLLIRDLAERERLTVRQLLGRLCGGRGHNVFTGTPEGLADHVQSWFDAGAADGFNIMPPLLPDGLTTFADHVLPELHRRGLLRGEVGGGTLRERYGLARPPGRTLEPAGSAS